MQEPAKHKKNLLRSINPEKEKIPVIGGRRSEKEYQSQKKERVYFVWQRKGPRSVGVTAVSSRTGGEKNTAKTKRLEREGGTRRRRPSAIL